MDGRSKIENIKIEKSRSLTFVWIAVCLFLTLCITVPLIFVFITPRAEDFKTVFSGLVEDLNAQLSEPDNLLKDVMSGNKNVDIHDVMTAMAKSEISVNIATQLTGKVIQAYDKIMQIQV